MVDSLAAIDDAIVEFEPHGDGHFRNVFVRNASKTKSIIVTIHSDNSDNFDIWKPDLARKRPFFPQNFERRIAQGDRKFVGRDHIHRILEAQWGGAATTKEYAANIKVAGARYVADESTPLPQPDPVDHYIYLYSYPTIYPEGGRGLIQRLVNISHQYTISVRLEQIGAKRPGSTFTLDPLQQKGLNPTPEEMRWAFVGNATFVEYVPST